MNLLLGGLPTTVEIGGVDYPIHTDFRTAIQFEIVMMDPTMDSEDKLSYAIALFFDEWPDDVEAAIDAILFFYRGGEEQQRGKDRGGEALRRVYSFEFDDKYIYAAFMEQYQIDLTEVEMHWWKFKALFNALSPDTLFRKIMEWRGADIDAKLPAAEKNGCESSKRSMLCQSKERTKIRPAIFTLY